jgi:hypothetical protein
MANKMADYVVNGTDEKDWFLSNLKLYFKKIVTGHFSDIRILISWVICNLLHTNWYLCVVPKHVYQVRIRNLNPPGLSKIFLNEIMMIFLKFTTIMNVYKWCYLCILVELFVYNMKVSLSCPPFCWWYDHTKFLSVCVLKVMSYEK